MSSLTVDVDADGAVSTLRLSREDAARAGGAAAFPAERFDLRFDDRPVAAGNWEARADADGGLIVTARFAGTGQRVSVFPVIAPGLSEGHRQLVRVRSGDATLRSGFLASGDAALVVARDRHAPTPQDFAVLGFQHVLSGFDHLLFLLALLLVCPRVTDVIRTTLAFTLAHSLTLAAVTVGGLEVAASWVEPAIAVTVVLAALRAGLGRSSGAPRFAFGFGLLHGLGFAGMLGDLLDRSDAVALPLIFFNVGVEAGQMLAVACVLPLLWLLARRPQGLRALQPVLAASVAVCGVIWAFERIAFQGG